MGLEIWFREDIERIVNALELTAQRQKPDDFQAGFLAALQAVRAAFGLPQITLIIPGVEGVGLSGAVLRRLTGLTTGPGGGLA